MSARVPIRERQVVKGPVAPQKFEQQPVCSRWKPGNYNGEAAEASWYATGLFQSATAQRVRTATHLGPKGSGGARLALDTTGVRRALCGLVALAAMFSHGESKLRGLSGTGLRPRQASSNLIFHHQL